jgi:hypothetical protein
MALLTTLSPSVSLRGRLRLAHVLRMPERDAEAEIQDLESSRAFQLLREARVVSLQPYPRMRFGTRRFEGCELRASGTDLPEVLDGRGDLVRLMENIGQDRFEEYFLRAEALTDHERALACEISPEQAKQLRELVDRLYVQSEFEARGASQPAERVMSAVAGVEIENGRPVLAFFHQAREAEGLLFRLDLLERRKSTLYQALEMLLAAQADYLATGDPGRRVPLTQRTVAARLGVAPSSFSSVVSNKAIQLPWGLEAPLKTLMPSPKTVFLERLYDLAAEKPDLTDVGLGRELARRFGARLSRRSVAQYRSDLGLAGRRRRAVVA